SSIKPMCAAAPPNATKPSRKNASAISPRRPFFTGPFSVAFTASANLPLLWRAGSKARKMCTHMNLCALFAVAQNPVSNYWHKLTDKTFSGIYHANAFDLMMMIPYFIVLIILAVYGLHRYWLGGGYYKIGR